ncbi:uncharacterized protein LOC117103186 isoform X1 [Anneissia japonica]|uniref:uncharacterized protein LOC117103186 isoform X1 n=1 Tax=Anneissia japonica TaxID=1529436 RepID=UPI001425B144|nr:uncharacterized protein LOC117103186 isoform X1 [Anneissia japonica]
MAEQGMTSNINVANTKGTDELERQRRKVFPRNEVLNLIRVWGMDEFQERFDTKFCHHTIWEEIAEKMKQLGFNRTAADYKSKMANIKTIYFKHKKALKSENPPMTDRNAREYFPEVEAVLKAHPPTRTANVLDSMSSFCSPEDLVDESFSDAAEIIFKSEIVENGSPNSYPSASAEGASNSNGIEIIPGDTCVNSPEIQKPSDVQEGNKRKSCNPRKRKLIDFDETDAQKEKLTQLFETMVDLERQSVALEKQRIDSERQFFHGMLTMMSQIVGQMTHQNSVGML